MSAGGGSLHVAEAKTGIAIFDEMGAGDVDFAHYALIRRWLEEMGPAALELKRREAEILFRRIGITFSVYTEGADPERLIPFAIIPRILTSGEWARLARGLEQRVKALNAFLGDICHAREIVAAGII